MPRDHEIVIRYMLEESVNFIFRVKRLFDLVDSIPFRLWLCGKDFHMVIVILFVPLVRSAVDSVRDCGRKHLALSTS